MKIRNILTEWQWVMLFGIILAIMAVIEHRFRFLYILAAIVIGISIILWIEYDMQQAKKKKKR